MRTVGERHGYLLRIGIPAASASPLQIGALFGWLAHDLGLVAEGLGEKDHIASPIKQTGASNSQIPIPNLLLAISASAPSDAGGAKSGWGSAAGSKGEPGKGESGMPFKLGLNSCCGVACVHGVLFGIGLGAIRDVTGTDAVGPAVLEPDAVDSCTFGKCTTPIAGKMRAKQLVAQIKTKPVNFMIF